MQDNFRLKLCQTIIVGVLFVNQYKADRVYTGEQKLGPVSQDQPPEYPGWEYLTYGLWKYYWVSVGEMSFKEAESACDDMNNFFKDTPGYQNLYFDYISYNNVGERHSQLEMLKNSKVEKGIWSGITKPDDKDDDCQSCVCYIFALKEQAFEEIEAPSCTDKFLGVCLGMFQWEWSNSSVIPRPRT